MRLSRKIKSTRCGSEYEIGHAEIKTTSRNQPVVGQINQSLVGQRKSNYNLRRCSAMSRGSLRNLLRSSHFLFMDNIKVMLPLSPFDFPGCTMTKSDELHHELAYLSDMLYLLYRKPLCWNFARDAAYR